MFYTNQTVQLIQVSNFKVSDVEYLNCEQDTPTLYDGKICNNRETGGRYLVHEYT